MLPKNYRNYRYPIYLKPNHIAWLKQHYDIPEWVNMRKLDYPALHKNPNIAPFLYHLYQHEKDRLHLVNMAFNKSPDVIGLLFHILRENHFEVDYVCHYIIRKLLTNEAATPFFHKRGSPSFFTEEFQEVLNRFNLSQDTIVYELSQNKSKEAFDYIIQFPEMVNWMYACSNPHALAYLRTHRNLIDLYGLSNNPHPDIFKYLNDFNLLSDERTQFASWVSWNPVAIVDMKEFSRVVNYYHLCRNSHPIAIQQLDEYINKHQESLDTSLEHRYLSENAGALYLYKKYPTLIGFIDYRHLSLNPAILRFNYQKIQQVFLKEGGLGEELVQWIWHPKNMSKWSKDWDLIEADPEDEDEE